MQSKPLFLSRRGFGLAAVIALHIPVIGGLLWVNLAGSTQRIVETPRETVLFLPLPAAKGSSAAPQQGREQRSLAPVPFVSPNSYVSPQAAAPFLGKLMFGCRPENLSSLTREEQERCNKLNPNAFAAIKDGLPVYVKPKGPEWEGLRNSDIRARERNTADPCMAAKATGTECIHDLIYGKGLW